MRILTAIANFFRPDPLVSGFILEKNRYHYGDSVSSVNLTGGIAYSDLPDTFSLDILGRTRSGKLKTGEVYVDELTWNNTEKGDLWHS